MKAKSKRALKHLENTRVAKWALDALKDYFNLCEQQVAEADMNVVAQIVLNKKREKIMAMFGIYVYPGITLETVNFLYDNIGELRAKNGHIPLMDMLFKLQMLFDDINDYCEIFDCEKQPLITPKDVREQKKKLNEKYRGHKVEGYSVKDYDVPEV